MASTGTTSSSHLERYIGAYANSGDFAFQEQMRKTDLTLKALASSITGSDKAQPFFVNGWGQVIGAAYLLEKNPSQIKISESFEKYLIEKLDLATSKGAQENNPFIRLNVRGFTKPIMMHPTHPTHAGKYFDWKTVPLAQPVAYLNQFIETANLNFSLYEGKLYLKINPEDESNIFNKLWATDFSQLLEEAGYTGVEKNKECPHVTLVNSDVIAKVQEQFNSKYGNDEGSVKFGLFFESYLTLMNETLKKHDLPVRFTEISSSYSEDYSPFEEVVVAKLEAPCVETGLQTLVKELEQELGITLPIKPKSAFHVTIATKYREPNTSIIEQIETIISETGRYSEALNSYWQQFLKA